MKNVSRRDFLKYSAIGLAGLTMALYFPFLTQRRALASSGAWKFGIMADTQWSTTLVGGTPGACALPIIDAVNAQFIGHGVKFVITTGDMVDADQTGTSPNIVRSLPTRAEHCQDLYTAGIGFFPIRGNHDGGQTCGKEIAGVGQDPLFPQTQGLGTNPLAGATNFSSPPIDGLQGLSYSFDVDNVRFVMIDQFVGTDGKVYKNYTGAARVTGGNVTGIVTDNTYNAGDQISWITDRLSGRTTGTHAFTFSHKPMIGENHKDGLFGANLAANPDARNQYIASLASNGVRYHICGHDHMHNRSIVSNSLTPISSINQLICTSCSWKVYTPASGDDGRETEISQELYTLGYYIVTVDGPRVWVDFYSFAKDSDYSSTDLTNPPSSFNFYLRETFGYSLNGKQFTVARGGSYTGVQDSFEGTTARILDGTDGNSETDYLGRNLSKTVNTGWGASDAISGAASKVLSLWGMVDNLSLWEKPPNVDLTGALPSAAESKLADTYALSLTYDPTKVRPSHLVSGKFCIANRKMDGSLVNAVDANFGGTKSFKYGPYNSSYGLGAHGVDPATRTVWAVVNYDGDFVAKLF